MNEGDVIAGRFLLEELAGSGGMSSVFRAKDLETGRTVALKSLHPEASVAGRFDREAAVLAELSHRSIVEHVAHGRSGEGESFIAMEWLAGEDLAARIARGRMPVSDVIAVGRAAAEALAFAHGRGVVHRDLKPSNLFLPGGDVSRTKLLDFGIVRLLRPGATRMTHAGTLVGTPAYMSPEQARGDVELDGRSDLFSLGIVLYECLTGTAPFDASNVMGMLAKVLLAEPPRLRDLGIDVMSALDELIAKMLAKNPKDRPQQAAEVARALEALDDAVPTVRTPPAAGRSGLTHGEQRLISVLFVGAPPPGTDRDQARAALENVVKAHGGGVEMLNDGSAVVLLSVGGAATDQAARAAEQGLAVRAALPFATAVLATGPGIVTPRDASDVSDTSAHNCPPVIGEVIDRAVARMREEISGEGTPSEAVAVDEVTAGLLDARFEIGGDAGGLYVSRRQNPGGPMRTLLGIATPFVGREPEMATLLALLDECASAPGARAALVTGGPGAGKSRLAAELALRAPERGFDVWLARGDMVKTHAPFALVSRAVEGLAQVFGDEPLAVRRRKLLARISRHLSRERAEEVACFLGEVSGTPFPDQGKSELTLARRTPVLLVDLVRRAFEAWIAAECDARPVLLIVEDLQWSDAPSARLLEDALRNLARKPFAVVGFARPDAGAQMPRFFQGREAREIVLGELPASAGRELARAVLGDDADDALLDAVVQRSGGNAFYLEELLRSVREGKGIASLPETVIAMIHTHLDAVSPAARRVLRAASVFGDVFYRSGIAALLGDTDDAAEVDRGLTELVEQDLLLPVDPGRHPGHERYAFPSALVREAAYAMLVDVDRERGHRRAAEWLETAGEPQAVVIAEHFERGARPERALYPYAAAARQALAGNDFLGAIARARRAVELGATGHTRGEILLIQADASHWLGESADSAALAAEALTHLQRGSAAWLRAATLAAMAESRLGHFDAFRAIVRDFVSEIGEGPPSAADPALFSAQVAALSRTAVASFQCGELAWGTVLLGRIRACRATGRLDSEPFLLGYSYRALGIFAHSQGDLVTALAMARKAAACFERAGALRDAGAERGNAGFFLAELGRNADAERTLVSALATAEQLGLPSTVASVRQNLAMVLSRRGALPEAIAMAEIARSAFEGQGSPRMITRSRTYLARLLVIGKQPAAAEPYARSASGVAALAPRFRAYALAVLAAALAAQGRSEEAAQAAAEAMTELDATGAEEGEMFVRLSAAEALLAAGRRDEARAALADAHGKLLRRAEAIRDPVMRESFLSGIPEHARIVALSGRAPFRM